MKQEHVYGIYTVLSILEHAPERIVKIAIAKERRDQRMQQLETLALKNGINVEKQARRKLDNVVQTGQHQGVVATCQPKAKLDNHDLNTILTALIEPPNVLVLDEVQDPHNLGACLRTADAAGVHAVVAPKDHACGLTPLAQKVAAGAAETVPFILVTNLAYCLRQLRAQNIWIYGAASDAETSLYQTDLRNGSAFVLGAEGKGLRRLTRELCDQLVHIPMAGQVASLNVSVATGIVLFELVRQRQVTAIHSKNFHA